MPKFQYVEKPGALVVKALNNNILPLCLQGYFTTFAHILPVL